jgi:hypothetical protein
LAQKKLNYTLRDGEELSFESVLIKNANQEDLINQKSFLSSSKSAIIRSFSTDSNNANDFVTYINSIALNRNLGYWSVVPSVKYDDVQPFNGLLAFGNNQFSNVRVSSPIYAFKDQTGSLDWKKIDGFQNYYRSIFQNKTARNILVNNSIDVLCSLCLSYPSDFQKSLISELDRLYIFTTSLPKLSASTNTDKLNNYWEGFIFRRHKLDSVPIDEIQAAINNARTKIKGLDMSNRPSAMYEIILNNHLSIYYSSEKLTISSTNRTNEISYNHKNTSIKSVKYFSDGTGDYYQFSGSKNSLPFVWLFDKNLEKID